jgi:hypothetical protein
MRDEKVVLEEDEGWEMGEPRRVWDRIAVTFVDIWVVLYGWKFMVISDLTLNKVEAKT